MPATAPERLLRRLEWRVLRRLDGRLQGAYRTTRRGTGIDFHDLRGYTAEDDVRHIDWNVTARLDEPHVRQYTEDRDLTAWLVVDRSASMRSGAGRKEETAVELGVCLARLFAQGGNRVGAVLFDNGERRVVPPSTGRTHVLHLAHELTRPGAPPAVGASTDLAAMLRLAATHAVRRGVIFVLSDFIGDGAWERELTRLGQRHEVVAVRLVEPGELELPALGLVLVEDSETGEQLYVDTSDPLFRQRLDQTVRDREASLATAMRRAGVAAHVVTTGRDLTGALVELVVASHRRRR